MTAAIFYIGKHRTRTIPLMDTLRDRLPTSYVGKHRGQVVTDGVDLTTLAR